MADLNSLLEKLRRMEALHARTPFAGEREAAEYALEQLRQRLKDLAGKEQPIEMTFSVGDGYARQLLMALLRRYGLTPYRYRGQRRTTVKVRAPESFINETIWPQFKELSDALHEQLDKITQKMIQEAVWEDASDAGEVPGLPAG